MTFIYHSGLDMLLSYACEEFQAIWKKIICTPAQQEKSVVFIFSGEHRMVGPYDSSSVNYMIRATFASHIFLCKCVYLCDLCKWAVDPLVVHWTRYKNRICQGTSQTRSELENSISCTLCVNLESRSTARVKLSRFSVLLAATRKGKHLKMCMLRSALMSMRSHAKVNQRSCLPRIRISVSTHKKNDYINRNMYNSKNHLIFKYLNNKSSYQGTTGKT